MTASQYAMFVGFIFTIAAVVQVVRLATGFQVVIGHTTVPVWVSWVALPVAVVLAWLGYTAG
ncbi:hypothetical protein [Mesorhizobium sophorae]|uniref:hypothetical protein n=1 Tax=Mesorhizobium sophorae TaxID=1300294 RepID=UPI000BA2EFE4|nr:hypothetical protein [Mesorhizobium sophorae]